MFLGGVVTKVRDKGGAAVVTYCRDGAADTKRTCPPEAKERKRAAQGQDAPAQEADPTAPAPSGEGASDSSSKRSAGKQPGAKGSWRSEPLVATGSAPHYPPARETCSLPLAEGAG